MTDFEKNIYNTYLAVTRSKQNKPFKLRKDFKDIKTEKCYPYILKLSVFFKRYQHIKMQDFFAAPYEIYKDTQHVGLDYYTTRAAIKTYSLYNKKIEDISPEKQIESIRESLHFIGTFCLRNNLLINEYLHHKTGCIYSWMLHYREHKINIYSLLELGDLLTFCKQVAEDEKRLLVEDLQENIGKYKIRYHSSSIVKEFVKEGTNKLKSFLHLHQNQQ